MAESVLPMPDPVAIRIKHLYISPAHNFFGHHGQPPGTEPMLERSEIVCVEGRGIEGDRFFDFKPGYKGQITFFESEVYEDVAGRFHVHNTSPSAFRRNVITEGIELNSLIGAEFEIQGIRFLGMAECSPCYWMDHAFHPGTEEALAGRGGLRAQILSSGVLRVDR